MTALSRIVPETRECDPTFALDRHIAEARERMGEERWQQLEEEWSRDNAVGLDQSLVEKK